MSHPHYSFIKDIFRNSAVDKDSTPVVVLATTELTRQGRTSWRAFRPDSLAFKNAAEDEEHAQAWYFSCAAHKKTKPQLRGKAYFVAAHVVVLDDVGTKVDAERILVHPTYVIETSEENFQYGYVLRTPCSNLQEFERAMRQIAAVNLTDGGSTDAVHLFRVPGSLHRTGVTSKLVYHEPELTFDLDKLVHALTGESLSAGPARGKQNFPADANVPTDDELRADKFLQLLIELGQVVGPPNKKGWMTVLCPWREYHTNDYEVAGYLGGGKAFKCFHEHCSGQTLQEYRTYITNLKISQE